MAAMTQQAPVFPKVPCQGPRFHDPQAIKNLRLDLIQSFSRAFRGRFAPFRAVLFKTRNATFRLLTSLFARPFHRWAATIE